MNIFALIAFCILLCSSWLIMHAMEYLIKISDGRFKRFLMFTICWVLSGMIIFIGDPFNILASTLCFLITIFITCEGTLWKKITIGTMFASTILSFNALRDNYLTSLIDIVEQFKYPQMQMSYDGAASVMLYPNPTLITHALMSLPFSFFLYIGIRKFAPDKDYTLSDSLWKLLFLLTATPFGIVLTLTTLFDWRYHYVYFFNIYVQPIEYLVLLLIAILSFISLLWCITVLAKQQKLEQQNMFMEINRKYYEAMEQQHFEIRRLKHDLANHLQVLSALPEKQRDAYLENLTENTAFTQSLSYCGDPTVNAVLTVKKNQMERYGIRMESEIDIPAKLPFDRTDICALYANALDNAVEACMKLEEDKRVITLRSKAQKGLFCLEVSNPIPGSSESTNEKTTPDLQNDNLITTDLIKSHSFPQTSKSDKANHGFGLRGIKEIVERYHGSLELKIVDGVFDLFLYIPLS